MKHLMARFGRRSIVVGAMVIFGLTFSSSGATNASTVSELLARVSHALGERNGLGPNRYTASGKLTGLGLSGTFQAWHDGDREREDEQLGPDISRSLLLTGHFYVQDANDDVREFTGPLLGHERTETFVESGAFAQAPQQSKLLGTRMRDGVVYDVLEVRAPDGDPETVEIDSRSALPARVVFSENDGQTTIDFSDWRSLEGYRISFRAVISAGDRGYDVTRTVQSVHIGGAIAPEVFAPMKGRMLGLPHPEEIPLVVRDGHLFVRAQINEKAYWFLVDSGAQNIVIDSAVARTLGLHQEGNFLVSGAARAGGLHLAHLAELRIGSVSLRDLVVAVFPLGAPSSIDGILGYPFFASAVVRMDVAHRTMRLSLPGMLAPEGDRLSLFADRQLPETTLRINEKVDANFVIDTGNAADLLLYRPFIDAHVGLVTPGTTTRRGYGIGGATASSLVNLPMLRIGHATMHDVPADLMLETGGAFADRFDAGNVGLAVIRRFIVTFDFPEDAIYMKPVTFSNRTSSGYIPGT
ncbi:MAG TPA: aspartyl protease family protein [Candidatus Baltobacteraceae bacterium]|nr:aspartyl protease family protein [Candidatus Baltobacteraceae bacterium]